MTTNSLASIRSGAEAAHAVAAYFADAGSIKRVADFKALGVSPRAAAGSDGRLAGKTFVLAGTFPTMSRARLVELVEGAGGKVADGPNRRTSFIVAGAEPGAKLAQARELGVAVIYEAELWRMLELGREE